MSAKIHIALRQAPEVITDSAKIVLAAHGYRLVDAQGQPLGAGEVEAVMVELGRNTAQALVSIDTNPENE